MKSTSITVPAGLAIAAMQALAPQAQGQEAPKRLNIIHIMTDDHSYQAISAYGHPLSRQAPTPNMDRLASEGIRFDKAYVENSLSTTSRATTSPSLTCARLPVRWTILPAPWPMR